MILPKSDLYVHAWAGKTSTEMRMWIKKNDINNLVEYGNDDLENKMFYFNSIERGLCYHENINADKVAGFCHCNDCALENIIWSDYIKKYGGGKDNEKNNVDGFVSI